MAQKSETAPAVGTLSFEEALRELEETVRQLESGEVELERSIAIYERGAALKRHCEAKLESARMRVEKIVLASDGAVQVEPADGA